MPGHSRLHKLLGSALFAVGDLAAAEAALRRALNLRPAYADAWCDLGATLSAAGRPQEALAALSRAGALAPGHLEALYIKGNVHRQMADFTHALHCYDAVQRLTLTLRADLPVPVPFWRSCLDTLCIDALFG